MTQCSGIPLFPLDAPLSRAESLGDIANFLSRFLVQTQSIAVTEYGHFMKIFLLNQILESKQGLSFKILRQTTQFPQRCSSTVCQDGVFTSFDLFDLDEVKWVGMK